MNVIPKILEITGTVAFCISIFAHDHRTEIRFIRHEIGNPIHIRIHGAENIGDIGFRESGFVLDKTGLVVFLDPTIHGSVIHTGSGLITQ